MQPTPPTIRQSRATTPPFPRGGGMRGMLLERSLHTLLRVLHFVSFTIYHALINFYKNLFLLQLHLFLFVYSKQSYCKYNWDGYYGKRPGCLSRMENSSSRRMDGS
jgi:hypothetical protein